MVARRDGQGSWSEEGVGGQSKDKRSLLQHTGRTGAGVCAEDEAMGSQKVQTGELACMRTEDVREREDDTAEKRAGRVGWQQVSLWPGSTRDCEVCGRVSGWGVAVTSKTD